MFLASWLLVLFNHVELFNRKRGLQKAARPEAYLISSIFLIRKTISHVALYDTRLTSPLLLSAKKTVTSCSLYAYVVIPEIIHLRSLKKVTHNSDPTMPVSTIHKILDASPYKTPLLQFTMALHTSDSYYLVLLYPKMFNPRDRKQHHHRLYNHYLKPSTSAPPPETTYAPRDLHLV